MKRNQVTLAVLLAALSCFAAPSAKAISQYEVRAIKKAVANVPTAEVAAKAAQIVVQANASEKRDVAVVTVREIVSNKPSTVLAVVAAVSKAAPEVSPAVAAEAARICSEQSPEIARAAATSAPGQADEIAAAVAKVTPNSATTVTRTVAFVVPDQSAKVVETVSKAVPTAAQEIKTDATITQLTRSTQRSANNSQGSGVITTIPGTIRGGQIPNTPPTPVGQPIPYGSPQ